MKLNELLIEVMVKEYKERKEDWRYAQNKIDSGSRDGLWYEIQDRSIKYQSCIEMLLKRANISLEVLKDGEDK